MIIPLPKDEKSDYMTPTEIDHERVKEYLKVPAWKCPICGLNNSGRNKRCADLKCRKEKNKSWTDV